MPIDVEQLTPGERLLWGYGITHPEQIDLDAIANDCDAVVKYRALGGCEARLVAGEHRAIISVNSDSSPGRQRFSLAHELAHWICDRHTGSFLCAKSDIGPQNAEAKSVEAHANGYASQLVLPTYLVDPWLAGRAVSLEVGRILAKDFKASFTAALIKMVKRSPSAACVTCHSQNRLAWHQRSSGFSPGYFVLPELHYETDAFGLVFGGTGMSRPRREPAARWISGENAARMEITSQSLKLPDGTVLSLLVMCKEPRGR